MSTPFPALDPIPLPAPVWLFKVLHVLLLSLHFVAVHLLIGGLVVAFLWNLLGWLRRDEEYRAASGELAGYLPVVMTYVINLGVPPLLFTQVLYGVALYTSSILIGAYWISVIFLLIVLYGLLYVMTQRATTQRAWWGLALISVILAVSVAKIYVTNMTLMIRPEVWLELYRAHPRGTVLPPHDPTIIPRWLFMIVGALTVTGAGLVALAQRRIFCAARQALLAGWGGRLLVVFAPVWMAAGWWVWHNQPGAVAERMMEGVVFPRLGTAWMVVAGVLGVAGWLAQWRKNRTPLMLASGVALLALVADALAVIFRDGLRDATLAIKGFNLWGQAVQMNVQVLVIFGVPLVVGLAVVAWLVVVMARARPAAEVAK
jgi:hypothetical protein